MAKWCKNLITAVDMYSWYKSTVKDHVDHKTFMKVIRLWGDFAREHLLEGKDIPLYVGFKKFGVRKKYKPTFVDHGESKKQGKLVIGSNSHADFYGAKFYWRTFHTPFNKRGWIFVPYRRITRAVSAVMQTPGGHRRFVEQIVISGTAAKKRRKRFKI